jgi:hypothetical protein
MKTILDAPNHAHLTAAPPGSWTVQVICQQLLQPTGRFRRRSLSLVVWPLNMRRVFTILFAGVFLLFASSAIAGGYALHDWAIEVPGGWLGYVAWGGLPLGTFRSGVFYFGPLDQVETSIGPVPVAVSAAIIVGALITWAVVVVRRRSRSRVIHAPNAA